MREEHIFEDVAKKLRALDNPTKLKILALLVEEGAKSVTDISRELAINFSTAHKYLEQLEKAGLVLSKQVSENRLKRLFFVKDFELILSSSAFLSKDESNDDIKILNQTSKVDTFNVKEFVEDLVHAGIQLNLIKEWLAYVRNKLFDEISIVEIEHYLLEFLKERLKQIENALNILNKEGLFKEDTFLFALKQKKEFDLLKYMVDGYIHIENMGNAMMMNFSHDLHLISILGFQKSPRSLNDFFNEILYLIKNCNSIIYNKHALDSFNYFTAPFIHALDKNIIQKELISFFKKLDELNLRIYISLDIGTPNSFLYIKALTPKYAKSNRKTLKDIYSLENSVYATSYKFYKRDAELLLNIILNLFNRNKYKNIFLILKFWKDWNKFKFNKKSLKQGIFLANMIPAWQESAAYVNSARFDSSWKHWYRTVRVGEVQCVSINLPRLALEAENIEQFFTKLKQTLEQCYRAFLHSAEFVISYLHSKDIDVIQKQRRRGQYVHLDDGLYTVSICGLKEAVELLKKKFNKELTKEILEFCKSFADKKCKLLLRIAIKENVNAAIAKRFYLVDSKHFKLPFKTYSIGLPDDMRALELHKYLRGGHCAKLPKSKINLDKLLQKDWGLIKII